MEEEVKFFTGDVVRLKSGGPKMTVYRQWDSDQVECNHFVADAMRSVVLPPQMLELIDDQSFGLYDADPIVCCDDPENPDVDLPAYDHIGEEPHGPALSDEELDALMYISEAQQYGGRSR